MTAATCAEVTANRLLAVRSPERTSASGLGQVPRDPERPERDTMRMDIDALRAQTPGCAGRIHLNNAGAALMSQPTLEAMTAQLRREAEIGGDEAAAGARDAIAATYAVIAELVGGRSEEVALFDNAPRAWNAGFYSVPLRRGDQVLTGRAEYGSNVLAY